MIVWVSVKDRLPSLRQRVLLVGGLRHVVFGELLGLVNGVPRWNFEPSGIMKVTHWTTIPNTPEPPLSEDDALRLAIQAIEFACLSTNDRMGLDWGKPSPERDLLFAKLKKEGEPILPMLRAALAVGAPMTITADEINELHRFYILKVRGLRRENRPAEPAPSPVGQ